MDSTRNSLRVEGICRTCMNETVNLSSIYDYPTRNDYVHNPLRFVDLLAITIPQLTAVQAADELPKEICIECISKLLSYHEFQEMCLQSEIHLRKFFHGPGEMESKILLSSENNVESSPICLAAEDPLQGAEKNDTAPKLEKKSPPNSVDEAVFPNIPPSSDSAIEVGNQHMNDADDGKVKREMRFQCGYCERLFSKTYNIKRHLKGVHDVAPQRLEEFIINLDKSVPESSDISESNAIDEIIQPEGCDVGEASEVRSKRFRCSLCNRRFDRTFSLKRHFKAVHKRVLTSGELQIIVNTALRRRRRKPKGPRLECEICKKTYLSSLNLRKHLSTHTQVAVPSRYLCSMCGKGLSSASCLKEHLLRHSDERIYECPECPKRFRGQTDVVAHRRTHLKAKPFVCDICGKGFTRTTSLRTHKMIHSGEKPYKCDYCDWSFSRIHKKIMHMRTHTGEKPYQCKYCERAFAQKGDLNKHFRLHVGDNIFQCELCPQSFRLHSEMREHFIKHKTDDAETRQRNLLEKIERETQMKVTQ